MTLPCPRKQISNYKFQITNKIHQAGFTLIELLVVVAIIGVLTSIGVASYNNFNERRIVEKAARELKTNLRLAQSKAMNNEKDTSFCGGDVLDGWYIEYIDSLSYKLYGRCGGSEFDTQTITLENARFNDNFGTIQFKPLGGTDLSDNLDITVTNGSNSVTITVDPSGDIK